MSLVTHDCLRCSCVLRAAPTNPLQLWAASATLKFAGIPELPSKLSTGREVQNQPGLVSLTISPHLSRVLLYLGSILTSLLFLVVNLTCAMLIHNEIPEKQLRWTVLARALLNDSLFILCAISLACCMCKLGKMSSANVYLESKVGECLGNSHWGCSAGSGCAHSGLVAPELFLLKFSFQLLGSPLCPSAHSCCGSDVSCMF